MSSCLNKKQWRYRKKERMNRKKESEDERKSERRK